MRSQRDALLLTLYRAAIIASDADTGLAQLQQASAINEDWRATVAEATAAGLVYDPVRLLPGALQCHWRLELTPIGFQAARELLSSGELL